LFSTKGSAEIEEGKQDGPGPIKALNRLSESNVVSVVDKMSVPGTGKSSEDEKANGSKREGLRHFLNSNDELRFLSLSTTTTSTPSLKQCMDGQDLLSFGPFGPLVA
jgi:hypothetical protein